MILACVAVNAAEAEQAERRRFRRRRDFERRLFRTTLSRLADVVAPPEEGTGRTRSGGGPRGRRSTTTRCSPPAAWWARGSGVAIQPPLDAGERRSAATPSATSPGPRGCASAASGSPATGGAGQRPAAGLPGGGRAARRPAAARRRRATRWSIRRRGRADPVTAAGRPVAGAVRLLFLPALPARAADALGPLPLRPAGHAPRDWLVRAPAGPGRQPARHVHARRHGLDLRRHHPGGGAERSAARRRWPCWSAPIAVALFQFTRGIAMLRLEGRMDGDRRRRPSGTACSTCRRPSSAATRPATWPSAPSASAPSARC